MTMKTQLTTTLLTATIMAVFVSNSAIRAQNVGAWLETDEFGNQRVRTVHDNNYPGQNQNNFVRKEWRIDDQGRYWENINNTGWVQKPNPGNQQTQDSGVGVGVAIRVDESGNEQQFINGKWQTVSNNQGRHQTNYMTRQWKIDGQGRYWENINNTGWVQKPNPGNQQTQDSGVGVAIRIDESGNEQQFINGEWQNVSNNQGRHQTNYMAKQWKIDGQGRYWENINNTGWVQKPNPRNGQQNSHWVGGDGSIDTFRFKKDEWGNWVDTRPWEN